jgi:hypothetical protein
MTSSATVRRMHWSSGWQPVGPETVVPAGVNDAVNQARR